MNGNGSQDVFANLMAICVIGIIVGVIAGFSPDYVTQPVSNFGMIFAGGSALGLIISIILRKMF